VAVVRETFPKFEPEQFPQGQVSAGTITPQNFSPAQFWGPARPQGMRLTPRGILVETNGFDLEDMTDMLPPSGVYFDRQANQYNVDLNTVFLSALTDLENRMQLPLTPNPPFIRVNHREARVDLLELESILYQVRDALSLRLPEVSGVDPGRLEIIIEPSIFYVRNSNFGDTWAGGLIQPLSGGRYRIHLMLFYINGQRHVSDWRVYLVSEAINFYVLSIGRPDLAR
jgi:hypothetical protein